MLVKCANIEVNKTFLPRMKMKQKRRKRIQGQMQGRGKNPRVRRLTTRSQHMSRNMRVPTCYSVRPHLYLSRALPSIRCPPAQHPLSLLYSVRVPSKSLG